MSDKTIPSLTRLLPKSIKVIIMTRLLHKGIEVNKMGKRDITLTLGKINEITTGYNIIYHKNDVVDCIMAIM